MSISSEKPIKTGLLAYGMSGKVFHAPFLHSHSGFDLAAVVERTKKLATQDYPGIKSYASIVNLLEESDAELAVVNTPNYLHFEHAKAALLAGKHILVEKPFCAASAEAKELFQLGKEKGLKVMVYQNRRFSSDFLAAKKIINSGRLGKIVEVHLRFDRYRPEIGPKAFKEQLYPASGILYDLGAHLLDQAISVFGRPDTWSKTLGRNRKGTETDDFGYLHLKYNSGTNVFITVSLLVADPLPGLVIHGTSGSFVKSFSDVQEEQSQQGILPCAPEFGKELPGMEGRLTLISGNGTKTSELIAAEKGNMMGIFEAVWQSVKLGREFPVKQEEIIAQLEILEQEDRETGLTG